MADISIEELNKSIKEKKISSAYLFFGDEDYLKRYYKNHLRDILVSKDDTMNYSVFQGKDVNIPQITDLCETMPFMSEYRLIIMEDTELFKTSSGDMADYIKDIPESTCIIFVEKEVDKRGKMYKAVSKNGVSVNFEYQSEDKLIPWIAGICKNSNKVITKNNALFLISRCGVSMDVLYNELQKLIAYSGDEEEIKKEYIEEVCVSNPEDKVFDMIDAMSQGNMKKTLALYNDLLALKEAPMKILSLINRHFKILLQVKDMKRLNKNEKEIASTAGIHPFFVKNYYNISKKFAMNDIKNAIKEGAEMDELVKTGNMTDTLCVETFLVKYGKQIQG